MGAEKPWQEPFDNLLRDMTTRWGGKVTDEQSKLLDETRSGLSTSLWIYPVYSGELNVYPFSVTVSERPIARYGYFDDLDNVEHLRLTVTFSTPHEIIIRREGIFDRFKKAAHLAHEVQTGDEDFDRRYFLQTSPKEDRSLLRSPKFRSAVKNLEPFTVVGILPSGVTWAVELKRASQLHFEHVHDLLTRLMHLADVINARL